MRPLYLRHPLLQDRVPSVRLATLPTRVHRLPKLSQILGAEVWIKRDDETHPELGGSKIRALEFFLGEAACWARPFVAYGPEGSGWLLGLARFGARQGLDFRILSFPQPHTASSFRKYELLRKCAGERLQRARDAFEFLLYALHACIRMGGGSVEPAPPGGSDAISTLGYVNAAYELATQVSAGECPAPDVIVLPLGSGGLAAGLALGLALAPLPTRILAVSVAPRIVSNYGRVVRLLLQTAWALDVHRPQLVETEVTHRYRGTYGRATPGGLNAAQVFESEEGIHLDPTYSAKAAAALLDLPKSMPGKRILFWHTYGIPSMQDVVV